MSNQVKAGHSTCSKNNPVTASRPACPKNNHGKTAPPALRTIRVVPANLPAKRTTWVPSMAICLTGRGPPATFWNLPETPIWPTKLWNAVALPHNMTIAKRKSSNQSQEHDGPSDDDSTETRTKHSSTLRLRPWKTSSSKTNDRC
jgi:hypothetical protein